MTDTTWVLPATGPACSGPPLVPTSTDVPEAAWMGTDGKPFSVQVLMGFVLAELKAIGRTSRNEEQKFDFRGIDDTKDALNPLLSKYGIFYTPDVLERVADKRTTRSGSTMYEVSLHIRYTFHGPAGDWVAGSAWGEGTDMGDKSTNKAMTGAEKQMLFQAFAIATKEQRADDQDGHSNEETVASIQCRTCLNETGESGRFPDHRQGGDPEPYRVHMIEHHGFVRLPDGRVQRPETPADDHAPTADESPQDAPTAPADPEPAPSPVADEPAPDPATPDPAPDPEPEAEPETPRNKDISEKEVAYVDKMKGAELVDQLKKLGLPVGGKVDELKARLKDFLLGGGHPDAGTDPDPEPAAEPDPPAEGLYECPEDGCDVFPFKTEDAYIEHWNEVHGEGGTDEQRSEIAAADDGSVPSPEQVEAFKAAVGGLRGAAARAYGKYRRDVGLPTKAEDLSLAQLLAALDKIGELEE